MYISSTTTENLFKRQAVRDVIQEGQHRQGQSSQTRSHRLIPEGVSHVTSGFSPTHRLTVVTIIQAAFPFES